MLKISIIQKSLHWEQEEENLRDLGLQIGQLQGTDLILLPEMFATGFSMDAKSLADGTNRGLNWMKEQAAKNGAAVCGSLMVEEGGRYFNRLYFVEPGGRVHSYNKRHLFTYGGEEKVYEPGRDRLIVEYKGWKICPLVCYDLRFPVFSRNDVKYDLLIYVANWPERRASHWKTLLKARAIENQCYLAACNRVGEDGNGMNHSGDSVILDFMGEAMEELSGREGILTAQIEKRPLDDWRSKFPVLGDADGFTADWK